MLFVKCGLFCSGPNDRLTDLSFLFNQQITHTCLNVKVVPIAWCCCSNIYTLYGVFRFKHVLRDLCDILSICILPCYISRKSTLLLYKVLWFCKCIYQQMPRYAWRIDSLSYIYNLKLFAKWIQFVFVQNILSMDWNMPQLSMVTSSNWNISRLTGPLCGEFIGDWWIPRTKASDAELWYFFLSTRWINGWVNNREAGDLRCQRAHYHVIVMYTKDYYWWLISLIHISVSRHDFYLIMKYGIQVWRVKNNCRYAPIGIQKSLAPIKCIYF